MWDHPRSRGEYCVPERSGRASEGSSPLSRGIRMGVLRTSLRSRIIPALAGNTPVIDEIAWAEEDHPRSRGEYVTGEFHLSPKPGSSPLSRGILSTWTPPSNPVRIIPALAGNTGVAGAPYGAPEDHPRSRGEYQCGHSDLSLGCGSSPLSRGIHHFSPLLRMSLRIIPALAGNTSSRLLTISMRGDHPRSRGEYPWLKCPTAWLMGSSPLSRGIQA